MELQLKIAGILLMALAFMHNFLPKHFEWKKELLPLGLMNKQMMYVHTFFVGLTVFLMGLLCFFCAADLVNTRLGKQLSLGLFIFWGFRLVFQFFVFSPKLWKGKKFETTMHILFSIIWIYLTTIFLLVYLAK